MKMNEILKKRIDERLKIVEEGAVAFFTGEDSAVAAQYLELVKMAFTVGAEYALKSQWISIDEALPEEDPDLDKWLLVLVRVKTEEDSTVDVLQLGLYYGNGRFSCESRNIKAVAWMPVPEIEE